MLVGTNGNPVKLNNNIWIFDPKLLDKDLQKNCNNALKYKNLNVRISEYVYDASDIQLLPQGDPHYYDYKFLLKKLLSVLNKGNDNVVISQYKDLKSLMNYLYYGGKPEKDADWLSDYTDKAIAARNDKFRKDQATKDYYAQKEAERVPSYTKYILGKESNSSLQDRVAYLESTLLEKEDAQNALKAYWANKRELETRVRRLEKLILDE